MGNSRLPFSSERLLVSLEALRPARRYWIAYSGGADSSALLHAIAELRAQLATPVRALHVNHGLHPDAAAWQAHCERTCERLGIELEVVPVQVDAQAGQGVEAAAREGRYRAAADRLGPDELLLTGHHADDQGETLFLNLMRGSGVDGLAGMPALRPLGEGWLARPLLAFGGAALRDFLLARALDWIEDPSNQDPDYDRNVLRREILPALEARWPGVAASLIESADHCREAAGLLAGLADQWLESALVQPFLLRLDTDLLAHAARFKLMVRRWLHGARTPPLPSRRLDELLRQARLAGPEHHVSMAWCGWSLNLFQDHLWLQSEVSMASCPAVDWTGPEPLPLGAGIGTLAVQPVATRWPDGLRVRAREGGERITLAGSGQRKRIKDLLREAGVPPWLRASIPLLCWDDEVVALGDWLIGERLENWLRQEDVKLIWQPLDPILTYVAATCRRPAG